MFEPLCVNLDVFKVFRGHNIGETKHSFHLEKEAKSHLTTSVSNNLDNPLLF